MTDAEVQEQEELAAKWQAAIDSIEAAGLTVADGVLTAPIDEVDPSLDRDIVAALQDWIQAVNQQVSGGESWPWQMSASMTTPARTGTGMRNEIADALAGCAGAPGREQHAAAADPDRQWLWSCGCRAHGHRPRDQVEGGTRAGGRVRQDRREDHQGHRRERRGTRCRPKQAVGGPPPRLGHSTNGSPPQTS